jgi:DNA polymerase-3 subunit epsilon
MYLFNDTETTGFPSNSKKARDPGQARICQSAFILCDEKGRTLAETRLLIRPDNWAIQQGAFKAHGLTDELCARFGVGSWQAFQIFAELAECATVFVTHNNDFDYRMLEIEAEAHEAKMPTFEERVCTMKGGTAEIVGIAKGNGYKWPSLDEALRHFCGRGVGADAHDAMVDCRAAKDIFFAWRGLGKKPANDAAPVAEAWADLV